MRLVPAQTDKELSNRLLELSKENLEPVLLHDGTEREIPGPADYNEQKEQYSEKKKRHTVKNAVAITASSLILFFSQTVLGKRMTKRWLTRCIPVPCTLYQATGYQGYAPEGVQIVQPIN